MKNRMFSLLLMMIVMLESGSLQTGVNWMDEATGSEKENLASGDFFMIMGTKATIAIRLKERGVQILDELLGETSLPTNSVFDDQSNFYSRLMLQRSVALKMAKEKLPYYSDVLLKYYYGDRTRLKKMTDVDQIVEVISKFDRDVRPYMVMTTGSNSYNLQLVQCVELITFNSPTEAVVSLRFKGGTVSLSKWQLRDYEMWVPTSEVLTPQGGQLSPKEYGRVDIEIHVTFTNKVDEPFTPWKLNDYHQRTNALPVNQDAITQPTNKGTSPQPSRSSSAGH